MLLLLFSFLRELLPESSTSKPLSIMCWWDEEEPPNLPRHTCTVCRPSEAEPLCLSDRIAGAIARGAVTAVVSALLLALVLPTGHSPVFVARAELPTSLSKYIVFEVTNSSLSCTSLASGLRGMISGWVLCTATLPFANYRFRRIMHRQITAAHMYQTYLPSLLRDVCYGASRAFVLDVLAEAFPDTMESFVGECAVIGVAGMVSSALSSVFNEWRGFILQAPGKRLRFKEFFNLRRYFNSIFLGAPTAGLSLMVGSSAAPMGAMLFGQLRSSTVVSASFALLLLFAGLGLIARKSRKDTMSLPRTVITPYVKGGVSCPIE